MRPLSGVILLIIPGVHERTQSIKCYSRSKALRSFVDTRYSILVKKLSTVKMYVTIASMEQLAKNYNMCIPCDKKTICVIAKSVLGIEYGHEGWKKHYHG